VTSEFIRRRETKSADRAILYCLPSLQFSNQSVFFEIFSLVLFYFSKKFTGNCCNLIYNRL